MIRINTHGGPMPEQHGDWIDLFTAEDVEIKKGDYCLISLGVSAKLPEGYYAMVVPRSSTAKKWGVIQANSVGIIDNAYSGDEDIWKFPAIAMMDTFIPNGTRICQFKVMPCEPVFEMVQVESTGNANRGGFGSTGD